MKIFEIILKLLFVIGSAYSIKAEEVSTSCLLAYLSICFVLGVVLIFNKKQSYGYKLEKREVVMRRIEGIILIAFSIFVLCAQVIFV